MDRRTSVNRGPRRTALAWLIAVALAMVASPATTRAATLSAEAYSRIDAHVRSTMTASAIPGISYAIVRDGEVVHVAAFGAADSSGRPMTTRTPIVIGSTGKTITALAIRQLVEVGRIDPQAPVRRYLPWFELATPGAADSIRVVDLLEHESGLSTASGQNPDYYEPGLTPEQVVRRLAGIRTNRAVGSYEYSNLNYVILGVIVEAVSGQSYEAYLRDHIFGPLGMRHSYAALEPAKADGVADGHRYLFGLPVAFAEPYPTGMVAAGYQISTAEDMARYVAAMSNHGRSAGADIVGAPAGAIRDYGVDWQPISGYAPGYTPGHSGTTLGTNTAIMYTPGAQVGAVVLANANPTQVMGLALGASDIALDVLRLTSGNEPASSAPTVRTLYLAVDAILLLLGAFVVIELIRLRGWRARIFGARRTRLRLAASGLASVALPLTILLGLPLWIGACGSAPAMDLIAAWRFLIWTLPDVALALLVSAFALLAAGVAKTAFAVANRQAISRSREPGPG